ncbi:MAG: isoleucine--tRNA ligase [bacterium]|nr:isoleucine--tRNA ligase [bacterium]
MTKKDLLVADLTEAPDLPVWEEKVQQFWQDEEIFARSLAQTENGQPWIFYDGPPFATGLPHYGHILASTTKDLFPRFQTMRGRHVERRWGWDCHGLPIENLVEKELNLSDRQAIEDFGIDKFCENCRGKVLTYADEWKKTICRLGRFVDMDHDYKTMNPEFMESVWWVFKTLWDKGLIYQGYKPMHVCPRCATPLSNFEVTQGYKDITDISVYVKFRLRRPADLNLDKPTAIVAWTTTPWTLPGNFLLAINRELEYSVVELAENPDEYLIIARERLAETLGDLSYREVMTLPGEELEGRLYEPLFPYFAQTENAFRVVEADFVTTEDGTGVVHIAPAYGENDFALGQRENLPVIHHVDLTGKFSPQVTDFAGMSVREKIADKDAQPADIAIIKYLAEHQQLLRKQKIKHSYPHCWRCDYPLLNYATASYFVKVTAFKDELLANNQKINWQPEHYKDGRFGKWLAGARDWAISRNRFWGTPLPLWRSDDGDFLCVGSKAELEELSGQKIADLHKPCVDKIIIEKNGKTYHRVSDVLDCWFESGSMPYAQVHFPFENEQSFAQNFPADFISEGQDQTRGWFYTLNVLATALRQAPAFKNVLVNGIILAEDGKKMSKKLHNYPEPEKIFAAYGADALRLYLMTSPVMKAENLNFDEKEVARLRRQVLLTLWNVYVFWRQAGGELITNRNNFPRADELPLLDQWLDQVTNQLIVQVTTNLEKYDVVTAGRLLIDFVDQLSTFYLRLSRERIKNNSYARAVLGGTLETLSKLLAPYTPFFAELLYQNLGGAKESVHLETWPVSQLANDDETLTAQITLLQQLLDLGRSARKDTGFKVRQPLATLTLEADENTLPKLQGQEELLALLRDELNVKKIILKKSERLQLVFETNLTDELIAEGEARELMRSIAQKRKELKLAAADDFVYEVAAIPLGWQTEIEQRTHTKLKLK